MDFQQIKQYFETDSTYNNIVLESKKTAFNQINFRRFIDAILKKIEKVKKLVQILSQNVDSVQDEEEKNRVLALIEKCKEIIKKQVDALAAQTKKNINKIDTKNPEQAEIELNVIKQEIEENGINLIDGLGIDEKIKEKEEKIEKEKEAELKRDKKSIKIDNLPSNKDKKRGRGDEYSREQRVKRLLISRILNALRLALLPEVDGDAITKGGGYFLIYQQLLAKQPSWMESVMKTDTLVSTALSKGSEESAEESDQLSYLTSSCAWMKIYVESEVDGELTSTRDIDKFKTEIDTILEDKEREIRNFYTSKDFNMGQFKGLQIKPEIRIPIYSKVNLAVSYKDRIDETPLKKYYVGFSSIIGGLFGAIPDKGDFVFAQKAADRNKAIVKGISAIISGTAGLIGGKQASRDYETGVKNISKRVEDTFSTKPSELNKAAANPTRANEDFVGSIVQPALPTSPGQLMQTPDSIPGGMDNFALLGPGKKQTKKSKGKKKKPASPYLVNNRIMKFEDFIKSKK